MELLNSLVYPLNFYNFMILQRYFFCNTIPKSQMCGVLLSYTFLIHKEQNSKREAGKKKRGNIGKQYKLELLKILEICFW